MQCPNCKFNNMPGSDQCGRCGSSLRLASAAIDIHPPRAGSGTKLLRASFPTVNRGAHVMAPAIHGVFRRCIPTLPKYEFIPIGVLLRLIVPGWQQIRSGQRRRGWRILFGYAALLVLGVLLLQTRRLGIIGGLMLGMAMSLHTIATMEVVTAHFGGTNRRDQTARTMLVGMILAFVVYLPLAYLAGWSGFFRVVTWGRGWFPF
jgi:hypothetical protein